jgi:hypothetical protein
MLLALPQWPQRRRPNTTESKTVPAPFLSDLHSNLIKDLFENPDPPPEGGRPRLSARDCLEGVIWILQNGAKSKELPER